MTPAGMEALLRRRLDDTGVSPTYAPSDLQAALNDGLEWVQARLFLRAPDWTSDFEFADIDANVDLYPIPLAALSVRTLEYLEPLDNPSRYHFYQPPVDEMSLRAPFTTSLIGTAQETPRRLFAYIGRFIRITPMPTVNITAGLRFGFVPKVSLDTLERMPTQLHQAAVLRAEQLLQPEMAKAEQFALLKDLLADEISTIVALTRSIGDSVPLSLRLSVNRDRT